ncbi:MAG: hydrogenase expression/formation protein HypE [Firmicutes bacterium]|nr:hydrogenase expression/formation protein HypE [Bacillota bacterium]
MKITMAHGSGGQSSAQLMSEIFGKHFQNPVLDRMEDAAVLDLGAETGADQAGGGRIACSTDSFVVTPLEFKGGDIGKLCVCGTVNDLLMMGAVPKYLTCGFILEEGLDVDLLSRLVASMAAQARAAGVMIIAGDTKVVEGDGGLYINTTGIGVIPEGRDVSSANGRPGDVVLISGNLGDHHACILSHRMEIENGIVSDCAALNDVVDALFDAGVRVRIMRDVTRGGLGTVINEIADNSHCRIELDEEAIPVSDQVKGFADILGLDPLYMGNEGKMIAVVPEEDAEKALAAMRSAEHGRDAALIGRLAEGNGAYLRTRLGASRRFDVLYGEGLPRIC